MKLSMRTRLGYGFTISLLIILPKITLADNVLLIIADDYGVDMAAAYGEGSNTAPTPNINALFANGVVFKNAWAYPVCSPTRASILTGRYSFRTGVGSTTGRLGPGIGLEEMVIPKALKTTLPVLATANVGKWHLSDDDNGGADNPNLMGYDYYSGLLSGALSDYYLWDKTVNGDTSQVDNYATSENVDDAINWLAEQTQPWFLWLAFNAPHTPFHLPPMDLHGFDQLTGTTEDIDANPLPYYQAMVEAMDTEIGRLLTYLDARGFTEKTTIIFIGDNGTPSEVTTAPFDPDRAKGTVYEGGINIPMVIAGPRVVNPGRMVTDLVSTVDLFATILNLFDVNPGDVVPATTTIDSISLLPYIENTDGSSRITVVSEYFTREGITLPNAAKTIRNWRFKLIRFENGTEEFYNLTRDPFETNNLLDGNLRDFQLNNYNRLRGELDALLAQ